MVDAPRLASMSPDELRAAMRTLGYRTQADLANAIGVSRPAVSLWLDGKVGVPRPVAMLLRMLIAAQRRSLVDSTSSDSYFRAVGRLSSDYERRRTLSALMKLRPTASSVLVGVLRSSESIASDYELASLLVEFARTVPVRGELREQYLKATRTLSSDYEYRRALQALLEQDRQS